MFDPDVIQEAPEPYQFQFENTDEDGNTISRSESGDANGAVSGSYGYKTADGVYRQVEYVSDVNGFRPKIKTNEQGTSNSASADVEIVVEEAAAPAPQPVHKIVKIIQPVHGRYIHVPYYGVHAVA
ncbi:cuticle protein 10.9-like [Limulus polyphemus]|uniref:Cuticle protein 10.9-like n=1 Tax=Limulus polyphemus TaxID=6850 RepID=A0ABM1BIR2_LIMPO|nr:cuticle protein 10.9-like [Limulus polyphemus]